jgi:two-component system sensor kinase FixL
MKQTKRMAKSRSIATSLSGAQVVAGDFHALAQFAQGPSGSVEKVVAPRDVVVVENTPDVLTRVQAQVRHATRLMTPEELTASIVHEVIQPLTVLVAVGEKCLRWLDCDEAQLDKVRTTVATMVESALHAADIIRRLRALSVKDDVRRGELDLNRIIEQAIAQVEPELRFNRVSLRVSLSSELAPVLGDGVQLQQVIINLLVNGIQAMASVNHWPRELLVRSQQLDLNHVGIMVQDSGTGIDPHNLDRLFETFFTTRVDGTGLGLSLCRWIVEAHGGLIWASSDSGRGAAFYFTLPAIRASAK